MNAFKGIDYFYIEQINADLVQLIFYLCILCVVICLGLVLLQIHFNHVYQRNIEMDKKHMEEDGLSETEITEVLSSYERNNTPVYVIVVFLIAMLLGSYIMTLVFPKSVVVDYNAETIAVEECFDKVNISVPSTLSILLHGSDGLSIEHVYNTTMQGLSGVVTLSDDSVRVGDISFDLTKLQEDTVTKFRNLDGEEVFVEYYEDKVTGATLLSSLIVKHIEK